MATRLGRGALGLQDRLRDFVDLLEQTGAERRVLVELRPGKLIDSWSADQGSTYLAALEEVHGGITLDVVEVCSDVGIRLSRALTLAACRSTAGSYFFDVEVASGTRTWGDGETWWGQSVDLWGAHPKLYVHLEDGTDPNLTSITARFAVWVAGRGEWVPDLGAEQLVDGGFETWPQTAWSLTEPANTTITQETTEIRGRGASSAEFTLSAASGSPTAEDSFTVVEGVLYRFSGSYQTAADNPSDVHANVRVEIGGAYLDTLGRDTVAGTTGFDLDATQGEWRRWVFDWRAPSSGTATVMLRARNAAGAARTATIRFDGVSHRPIHRFYFAEPRIGRSSLSAAEVGSNDLFFGGKRVGSGSVTVGNGDARFSSALRALDWRGQEARIHVAGAFTDGQVLTLDDARRRMTGRIRRATTTLSGAAAFTVELEDARAAVHRSLPPRRYLAPDFPQIDGRFTDKYRALLLGTKTNLTPVRISESETTGLGTYEVCDCDDAPNGIKALDAVRAYVDEEAAREKLSDRRLTLTAGVDYSEDLADGRFTLLRDVGPHEVEAGISDRLDFNIGGSALVATLTPGLYAAAALAAHVQAAIRAAIGGADTTGVATYSETTHLYSVGRSSGTFNALLSTGANKDRSAWKLLGFTTSADLSGSSSYTGDTAAFTDADTDHVLRVDARGYKDDASGTYTGSAAALIEKGPDIVRLLWRRFLGFPLTLIDVTTFAAARTTAAEQLGIYLGGKTSTKDVFDRVEWSCRADIVIDGAGVVYFNPYTSDVPAGAIRVEERDLIGVTEESALTDTYARIDVLYDRDPSTGTAKTRSKTNRHVARRFERPETREFETYLIVDNDAQVCANEFGTLAAGEANKRRFAVPGRLVDRMPGERVLVTMSRSDLHEDGELDATPLRIVSLRFNDLEGRTEAEMIDDVEL